MKQTAILLGLLVCIALRTVGAGEITKVEVFTGNKESIKKLIKTRDSNRDYILVIFDLDSVSQWEKEFSKGLSSNEEIARKQVDKKILEMGGSDQFNKHVLAAYKPLVRSTELGLMEYPAVVINDRFTIFGTDSPNLAIKRYKKWSKANQ